MWPALKVHWRERHNSPATGFDQARIIGGGSTVMGMVALRGTPDDYDEWERLGARGLGLGRRAAVFPQARDAISISPASCTAATGRRRSAA